MTCDACIFFFYSVHVCMQFTNKSLQYVQLYTCEFNFELFITSALLYSYYVLTKYSYHRVLLKTLTLIDVNWTLIQNDHWGPKMPFISLEVVEVGNVDM